ncbi:hypothetical protein E2562_038625 [Oryza meyeriana var. granulata]|uniref:Uncharacterized protein n=1 Tax=Oryza meyeriana var. granulata TaxID=110450 RepID=A0A6G1E8J0_9ORYZ|nr:hypothetical protein E2562_038625 [Oryza meyeriana var. granulata]
MAVLHVSSQASLHEPLERTCKGAVEPSCSSDPSKDGLCTSFFAFIILAVNCATAIYHSRRDPWSVAFVLAAFIILLLLFYALRVFDSLPHGSLRRIHVKAGVWVLSTVLTIMFSYRVAALMPFPVAAVIWAMAGSTIVAGFYMFFVCRDDVESAAEEKPAKVADMA